MATGLIEVLRPDPVLLLIAVVLDAAVGDPVYRSHPVRVIGALLATLERFLRAIGWNGYGGGVALFLALAAATSAAVVGSMAGAVRFAPPLGLALHVFWLYSFLAAGDLVRHVWRIERAVRAGDMAAARSAVARLVGRDTATLDAAACRRAGIESLSESLTDGFVSPLVWYALGGLPGVAIFKVVSTMDSMVGYKTPHYAMFGWCGARLDDLMNYVPARLAWLLIVVSAAVVPGASAAGAAAIGWRQHAEVPGPNAGWSEAATAGAIRRRLAGPIYREGRLVTDIWIGDPSQPPAATDADMNRALAVVGVAAAVAAVATALLLALPLAPRV